MDQTQTKFQQIINYHQSSKHNYQHYARSAGYLDWENQPNPFRFYSGTAQVNLPLLENDPQSTHICLYTREGIEPKTISIQTVGAFLELSLGLSAWKEMNSSRWVLRINPSSGNLHPTEAHLLLPAFNGEEAGVFHYSPYLHALERRAQLPSELCQILEMHFGSPGFLIGLSSIFWREAWKYGERAYRYCNHDVGHAIATLSFSASLQGWRIVLLNVLSTQQAENVLGLNQVDWQPLEEEHADLLCWVASASQPAEEIPRDLPNQFLNACEQLDFLGTPNPLSRQQVDWDVIYQTVKAAQKPQTAPQKTTFPDYPYFDHQSSPFLAAEIIRKRRSGASYDPHNSYLSLAQLRCLLDKTLPRNDMAPFDLDLGFEPAINLLLFIHKVENLMPGMYFYMRNTNDLESLQSQTHSTFLWQSIDPNVPLYLLVEGDFRKKAAQLSCQQQIAGDSAFSIGMITRFQSELEFTPYRYPQLYWEAGMIGQILYLEAEAQGFQGTGIGCYFDDPVHDLLGLSGLEYQSLYHFTVGKAIEDTRLRTFPPYQHLQDLSLSR